MKIVRQLKITEEQFYNYLEVELLKDINANTKRNLTRKDLQSGLKYSKFQAKSKIPINITINKYIRGSEYQSTTKLPTDIIKITYNTTKKDKGLEIIFDQNIAGYLVSKHNILMQWFSEAIYYGRMSDTLSSIQKNILDKQNDITR
ncbi:DUF3284 domain-containing protein [Oenococcus sp. UCMA 16435]|nr:DUF3284 domain-containing protein [Oenococcus sp. UCMA 16435]MDI4585165.1 DUF3284 domain-containing protein [Oenococcus sp. UCMA 14587]